jgi:alpha-beta hydrolase superfamily lysophospholipase
VGAEGALAAETGTKELEEAESRMTAPLLIIAAGANELPEGGQFQQALRNLDKRYPDSTFVLVPDAKHYVIASHPALVAETIASWIKEHQIE